MVICIGCKKTIYVSAVLYFPFFADAFDRIGKITRRDVRFFMLKVLFHISLVVTDIVRNFKNPSRKIDFFFRGVQMRMLVQF
jgi:hypothetical protein